jgi:heptosyltransferase III
VKPKKKKKRELRQAFARFLQFAAPRKNPCDSFTGEPRSIAILAQEKLGDSVLLTPLLKMLGATFPELEIHIITFSKASYNFFLTDSRISAVHYVKSNPIGYYREVLSKEFDLLFNTKDHPSTHFLLQTVLIRAKYKVGHASEFHQGLYDHLITMEFHSHIAIKNCALLSVLGSPATQEEYRPSVPPMPVSVAMKKFLEEINNGNAIGINLSAGEPSRKWQEKNWCKLLEMHPNEKFIVLCGPEELAEKLRIESHFNQVIPSPSTQNLYEASLIIATLKLLITPDTSLIHVASSSSTPVVGLYREAPQDISRFGPLLIPYELVLSTTGEVSDIDTKAVATAMKKLEASHLSTSWKRSV